MWKGHLPDALNWKLLEAIRAGDWGCRVLSSEGIFGFKSICLGWFGGGPGDKAIEACLGLSFAVLSWGPRRPQPPLCSALFPTEAAPHRHPGCPRAWFGARYLSVMSVLSSHPGLSSSSLQSDLESQRLPSALAWAPPAPGRGCVWAGAPAPLSFLPDLPPSAGG